MSASKSILSDLRGAWTRSYEAPDDSTHAASLQKAIQALLKNPKFLPQGGTLVFPCQNNYSKSGIHPQVGETRDEVDVSKYAEKSSKKNPKPASSQSSTGPLRDARHPLSPEQKAMLKGVESTITTALPADCAVRLRIYLICEENFLSGSSCGGFAAATHSMTRFFPKQPFPKDNKFLKPPEGSFDAPGSGCHYAGTADELFLEYLNVIQIAPPVSGGEFFDSGGTTSMHEQFDRKRPKRGEHWVDDLCDAGVVEIFKAKTQRCPYRTYSDDDSDGSDLVMDYEFGSEGFNRKLKERSKKFQKECWLLWTAIHVEIPKLGSGRGVTEDTEMDSEAGDDAEMEGSEGEEDSDEEEYSDEA